MNYYSKYLKYKKKYNILKNLIGGINNVCNPNKLIEDNIKIVNTLSKLTPEEIVDIMIYFNENSSKGPTNYSNWVMKDKLLMGAIPKNCSDLKTLIDNNITLFISLREEDELYQNCIHNKNPIFWRFRIPDLGTRDSDDVKALIDNIINYLQNDKSRKVMVHCLGGHGRTGTIICCLIAVLFFLNNSDDLRSINGNKLNIIVEDIEKLRTSTDKFIDFENKIIEISEKIFRYSQFYIMLSLASHRQTDSLDNRDLAGITIPETSAQKLLICQVIGLYIKFYIRNGYYNITKSSLSVEKCNQDNLLNEEHEKIWKCANLKTCN